MIALSSSNLPYPPPDFVEQLPDEPSQLRSDEYESLLRRDPQRYAELVQAIRAFGICLIDCDGRIDSWNRGASRLSGWRERAMIGRPCAQLLAVGGARGSRRGERWVGKWWGR